MHKPFKSGLFPDSTAWQKKTDRSLEAIKRLAQRNKTTGSSRVQAATGRDSQSVTIIIKGVYSSSSDESLDVIARTFESTSDVIYFSYNGRRNPSYIPEDTVSSTISTYSARLLEYLNYYRSARFRLVCHSLGGIIAIKLLYDLATPAHLLQRVRGVYLCASPVLLDGGFLYTQMSQSGVEGVFWKVISDYNVVLSAIPVLDRVVSIHCEDDRDVIALMDDACLLDYEVAGLSKWDDQVDQSSTHINIISLQSTIDLVRRFI